MSDPDAGVALRRQFGDIDIYLFDQLLRGNITRHARICDAGCGRGRNLVYLLREGYDVFAIDADAAAVAEVRVLANVLAPTLGADRFRHEALEAHSFPDGCADVVISSAVLHFARDHDHFNAMLAGSWRLLDRDGLFFCRLASSIGIESQVRPVGGGRFRLPDGSERYLVSEDRLLDLTSALGAELVDPLKTTVVQHQRSMTTWVMKRRDSGSNLRRSGPTAATR